jgi:Na+-transporting NADH:ubiquinone oxidoreductase subunit A
MDRAAALKVFRTSGCSLLFYPARASTRGDPFDGRFVDTAELDTVSHIIVNAVHNGPLDRGWKPDIFGETDLFLDGMRALKTLFPGSDITIAANRRNRAFFETPHTSLRIMSDRHPQELPELLARDIHGVAPGTTDPSVLVTPFEDVIQIAECMTRGRPLIDRIVLVAGPGVSKPGWYRIRIGTPFAHISCHLLKSVEYGPWRIIRGGILTGSTVSSSEEGLRYSGHEITVIREHASRDLYRFLNPGFAYDSYARVTMSTWLPILKRRLDSSVHGGVRPCVQCNFCDEVCPVGIYPHLIWKQVSAGFTEESFRLRPHLCVGCGLCDYVCPSKIDISRAVRSARAEYLKRRTA